MRLPRARAGRARIPAAPLFGVALLSFVCLAPAVFSSVARGIELGFDAAPPSGERRSVVWIRVLPGDAAVVDGEPTALAGIADRVAQTLARDRDTLVVLDVRPDVPFQAMIAAYDLLEGIDAEHGGPLRNLSIPSQRDIREYIQRYGVDPSEIWGSGTRAEPTHAGG